MSKTPLYALVATALFGLAACGQDPADDAQSVITPDGVNKLETAQGKADAFNFANDPTRFRKTLNYKFDELPTAGEVANIPWTDYYWASYEDGTNNRWQGKNTLSPAEKYDQAFNDWSPKEGFMALKPYNPDTCEWDDEYYTSLGPAATWADKNRGNWRAHNGVDDDRDGVSDKDECAQSGTGPKDWDGIEGWFGICHAWAPAALLELEPLSAVEENGVTFDVSDMKALLTEQYDRTSAYGIGERCNTDDKEWEFDEDGRIKDRACADMNPGALHVIVTNFIGVNKQGFVLERTPDYEVWNQPVRGYEITEQREVSLQEAYELLDIEGKDLAKGNGVVVQDVEEESEHARAILRVANESSLTVLDQDAGLYANEAKSIIEYRSGADKKLGTSDDVTIKTLQELDDIKYVGSRAFGRLLGFAVNNGFIKQDYKYNPAAERFVKVRLALKWITEQHPSKDRSDTLIDRYTRTDVYDYILELDADGKVLGGEYFGTSKKEHADFIWLPVRTNGGNPNVSLDKVRQLVKKSREAVLGTPNTETTTKRYTSEEVVAIPDADPKGAESNIQVADNGRVRKVTVNLNIGHTYRGDLKVYLRHGAIQHLIFDGSTSTDRSADNVTLEGFTLDAFNNSEAQGTWTIAAYDSMSADTGSIERWDLSLELEQ